MLLPPLSFWKATWHSGAGNIFRADLLQSAVRQKVFSKAPSSHLFFPGENTVFFFQKRGDEFCRRGQIIGMNDFARRMHLLRKLYDKCDYKYAPYFFNGIE